MTQRVVLATGNAGKVLELAALFREPRLELVGLRGLVSDDFAVDETGATFAENAWLKACAACRATGLPALADDSGLEVDALEGRPGVHSARYAGIGASDNENNQKLLRELTLVPPTARSARFRCVLALAVPEPGGPARFAEASGEVEGSILRAPRGSGGFGYDCLFEPVDLRGRSSAELSLEEKNGISHRARAAEKLRPALARLLARTS